MNEQAQSSEQARPLTGFDRAIQVGVVVKSIDQTTKRLTELFGIGPFRTVECPPPGREDRQFYHGEPARFRTRQAFANLGSIELELIEPLEGRSIWSDFLAERGPGIHHIRFNVPNHESLSTICTARESARPRRAPAFAKAPTGSTTIPRTCSVSSSRFCSPRRAATGEPRAQGDLCHRRILHEQPF